MNDVNLNVFHSKEEFVEHFSDLADKEAENILDMSDILRALDDKNLGIISTALSTAFVKGLTRGQRQDDIVIKDK